MMVLVNVAEMKMLKYRQGYLSAYNATKNVVIGYEWQIPPSKCCWYPKV